MATRTAIAERYELPWREPRAARASHHPWALALAVALPLAALYLIVSPPAGDLAAATYRSDLFARVGFATWDTGWYAAHGHWLPGYSLLSPALSALLGVRVLLVISGIAASVLFAMIARRAFDPLAARIAAVVFALGFSVELLSGRVPYDLGFAIGLATVLALMRGGLPLALGLAALTSVASPVAGAFLALAGLAYAAADARHGLALVAAALAPILALNLAFPEGGYEPFAASDFWLTLGGVLAIALLLPRGPLSARGQRVVRVGAALYALALIGSFAIQTPVGGNAARLGPPLAAPLLAGVLWERRRVALLALAPVVLYWQLVTPIHDVRAVAGDPSVDASYYAPVLSELRRLRHGAPTIVEVPLTKAHWEAAYLAGHDGVALARGWERQLDTRYGALFYRPSLGASAYRAWLAENRVVYVALPDAPLDKAGRLEGTLIARGVPYLRELWRSEHWRLYRFMG
ncbi:MAG TPA: hypothetical protein VGX51_01165 [Solirubrobacteraceae bacterium]|jgi:hypothetical protein|nr:hypothetical protein [Solirubrobacteraceae bacterium]